MQHNQSGKDSTIIETDSNQHLSEGSEQKKKEQNDRFFAEIAYLTFMESVYLHQRNIEYIKQMESESQFVYEQRSQINKANELNLVLLMQAKQQQESETLTKEQRDKLNEVNNKLEHAIGYIENLLKTLSENLVKQAALIEESKEKLAQAKQELANSVEKHFSDEANKSDFKPFIVKVDLPDEWNKMHGADSKYCTSLNEGYIEIDQKSHEQLGKDIAKDLKQSEGAKFEDVFRNQIKLLVKKIIGDQIGIDATNSRVLEEKINDDFVDSYLSGLMKNVVQNTNVMNNQKAVCDYEKAHEANVLTYQLMLQEEEIAQTQLEVLKQEHVAIKDALKTNQAIPDLEGNIQKIETGIDNTVNQIEEMHATNQESIKEIDTLNNIFAGLENNLEEAKSEENLNDVQNKIEEVHQKAETVLASEPSAREEIVAKPEEKNDSARPS